MKLIKGLSLSDRFINQGVLTIRLLTVACVHWGGRNRMANLCKKNQLQESHTTHRILLEDLAPRDNRIGRYNREYSRFRLGEYTEKSYRTTYARYSERQLFYIRLLCLTILGVTGALFTGFLVSLIVDGWFTTLGYLTGGVAGLMMAALFWATE